MCVWAVLLTKSFTQRVGKDKCFTHIPSVKLRGKRFIISLPSTVIRSEVNVRGSLRPTTCVDHALIFVNPGILYKPKLDELDSI